MKEQRIVAVDPGRDKCGVAVLDRNAGIQWHGIAPTAKIAAVVAEKLATHDCRTVVLGNQTYSTAIRQLLQELLDQDLADEMIDVDERGSTEAARTRYWQMNPPHGWRRLIPIGLLAPPCAVDDIAAIILGERYFEKKNNFF